LPPLRGSLDISPTSGAAQLALAGQTKRPTAELKQCSPKPLVGEISKRRSGEEKSEEQNPMVDNKLPTIVKTIRLRYIDVLEKDLRNWRGNKKNSGFLPEERAWVTQLLDEVGFVDVFRKLHPELEAYTWWSNRGQAWAKDVGWRLDYQLATPEMAAKAVTTGVYKEQRFSDHAPMFG